MSISLIKLCWYFLNLVWSMINSRLQVYTFPQIIWRSWQPCDTRRVNITTPVLQMSYMNFESNLLKVNSYYMTWERTRYSNSSSEFLYKMSIHSTFWHNSNRVHGNMFIRRQQWKKKGGGINSNFGEFFQSMDYPPFLQKELLNFKASNCIDPKIKDFYLVN